MKRGLLWLFFLWHLACVSVDIARPVTQPDAVLLGYPLQTPMTRTVRYNDLNVYDKVCLCDKVWYDMIRYNMIEEFTVDSKAERGQLRASFTNVDQAWTKFRFDLDLGLAVICVAPTQFRSNHELKLGLTLNCRGRRIKLWLSVQLALNSGPRTVIPAILSRLVTIWNKVHLCMPIASSFRLSISE